MKKQTLFSDIYEITQLTRNKHKWDNGDTNNYFYTINGTLGNTAEFECIADRSYGANSTCNFKDDSNIGVYTGLKIRSNINNTWFCDKIYMKIGGIVQREIGKCAHVGWFKTVTVKVSGLNNVRK